MKKILHNKRVILFIAVLYSTVSLLIIVKTKSVVKGSLYKEKVEAANIMRNSMGVIKNRKLEIGLSIDSIDINSTGMIGEQYSPITTTLGSIEAKRTSSNPDMAALVVHMLGQLNIQKGDMVGANFSGSFPSLNIAVLAACDAMDLDIVYICSIGSSNYGANQIEFTFPDMANYLVGKGILSTNVTLVTPGGEDDSGSFMDRQILNNITDRIKGYNIEVLREPDFNKNIEKRIEIYDENDIDVFISVGGNITSMGIDDYSEPIKEGIVDTVDKVSEKSGLIEIYSNRGVPTINLLNMKGLTKKYGLPYDPIGFGQIGEGPIYHEVEYNKGLIIFSIGIIFILLIYVKRRTDAYEE
jgi:poly-gamma-glutamate system protein